MDTITQPNAASYFTVKQLSERYQVFTVASLRYLIFNAQKNGFQKCIRKIGKKILISEPDFLQWIENHSTDQSAA